MKFEIVENNDYLLITNEEGLTLAKVEFFVGGKPHYSDVKYWLETLPNPPQEVTIMVQEMVHTIECLTERYTNIYPADGSMPWYWVRAVQTIKKAREWLGE